MYSVAKCFLTVVSACFVSATAAQDVRIEKLDFKAGQVNVLGELRIPKPREGSTEKLPLVLLLPNAGGMDGTGPQYSHALNQRGIATIDLNPLTEEDWLKNVGMALAATRAAVKNHGIDNQRVGIMGFSHGAMVSLIASSEMWMARITRGAPFRFKAAAALYPLCSLMTDVNVVDYMNWRTARPATGGDKNSYKGMFDQMTGGKVLLLVGENEDYEDAPTECPKLASAINKNSPETAQLTVYPGVGHGWDVPTNRTYNHGISRKNGTIRHHRFEKTFELSRAAVVEFFAREFQLP